MSAPVIPPGGTIVQTFRRSFVDVPIDADKGNAISTTEFLDAAESLTTMFGMIVIHGRRNDAWESIADSSRCYGLRCLFPRQVRHARQRQGTKFVQPWPICPEPRLIVYRNCASASSLPPPSLKTSRIFAETSSRPRSTLPPKVCSGLSGTAFPLYPTKK